MPCEPAPRFFSLRSSSGPAEITEMGPHLNGPTTAALPSLTTVTQVARAIKLLAEREAAVRLSNGEVDFAEQAFPVNIDTELFCNPIHFHSAARRIGADVVSRTGGSLQGTAKTGETQQNGIDGVG